MNDPIDSAVREFYDRQSLSAAQLDEMMRPSILVGELRRWRNIAITAATLCAALLVFATLPMLLRQSQPTAEQIDTGLTATRFVRVVGITGHGDACPVCSRVASTLASLRNDFIDQDVLFAELSTATPANQKQSKLLGELLGFQDLNNVGHGAILIAGNGPAAEKPIEVSDTQNASKVIGDMLGMVRSK